MIAEHRPVQRPSHAKLLVVDSLGRITHAPRSELLRFLRAGDLVVANDAATLPAGLREVHVTSGAEIEVRLAGRSTLAADDFRSFSAIVFGAGDFRTRTEYRPLPPKLAPGDRLVLGPPTATIAALLDHPRLISLRFDGSPDAIWAGLARHGRPIQYAHVTVPLELWDVWTPIAGPPVAFEAPSASFTLDWSSIRAMGDRGVAFATIELAAGISSTGDAVLDGRLPLDEPYGIPASTVTHLRRTRAVGGRVVAVGTTVVRALEHAAARDGGLQEGSGVATQRIGSDSTLRVVDALVTGTHEPTSSHYQLVGSFVRDDVLARIDRELDAGCYRTHEFGDSLFVERRAR